MKFASLLVALFVSLCASADVFYYQVNPTYQGAAIDAAEYSYLMVRAEGSSTYLQNTVGSGSTSSTGVGSSLFGGPIAATVTDANWAENNFIFELYNGQNEMVYYTTAAGSDLAQFTDWSSMKVYTVSNFTAVPEPTSGLLLMVGVGLLALRRRRIFNESSKI